MKIPMVDFSLTLSQSARHAAFVKTFTRSWSQTSPLKWARRPSLFQINFRKDANLAVSLSRITRDITASAEYTFIPIHLPRVQSALGPRCSANGLAQLLKYTTRATSSPRTTLAASNASGNLCGEIRWTVITRRNLARRGWCFTRFDNWPRLPNLKFLVPPSPFTAPKAQPVRQATPSTKLAFSTAKNTKQADSFSSPTTRNNRSCRSRKWGKTTASAS